MDNQETVITIINWSINDQDNEAILGYSPPLGSWYINSQDFNLIIGKEYKRFPTLIHLLEHIRELNFGYEIEYSILNEVLDFDVITRIQQADLNISSYLFGGNSQSSKDLQNALEDLLNIYIKFEQGRKYNPDLEYNDFIVNFNNIIITANETIHTFAEKLPSLSNKEMVEIAESYSDYYKLKYPNYTWSTEYLSNFIRKWNGVNNFYE